MDPSAAPWRVLEATAEAATGDAVPGAPEPAARAFLISPVTAIAVVGALVVAGAAFLLASASTGAGSVSVDGGGDLATIHGGSSSASPVDASGVTAPNGSTIVVEIVGAVRRPGVFHLPAGARIGDLVEAAGGYGPRLDTDRASRELNLAARLADGDRVSVPSRDEAASSTSGTGGGAGSAAGTPGSGKPPAGSPLDLNKATQAELEALPGIGPVTATKIITSREEQAFTAVDDLRTRKLVGAKTFGKLKDLVSVH
jgi:competence protein ComEA